MANGSGGVWLNIVENNSGRAFAAIAAQEASYFTAVHVDPTDGTAGQIAGTAREELISGSLTTGGPGSHGTHVNTHA